MTPEVPPLRVLPDPVQQTLRDFERALDLSFRVYRRESPGRRQLVYVSPGVSVHPGDGSERDSTSLRPVLPREGPALELQVIGAPEDKSSVLADLVAKLMERAFEFSQEVRFFTYELSERYEEINLLYSISETLGSLLRLDDAARVILGEVCDVLGAWRGSLWVFEADEDLLELVASVGEEGLQGPLRVTDPDAVTAQVFREGRPLVASRPGSAGETRLPLTRGGESFLSVPIRYTPPAGEPRTVGVINLIGRRRGGRFTASDQKLLSAIASQVGSALENHRLIRESLAQERLAREMELAHNLQMRLLPAAENFDGADVAAQVRPAAQVGGDFFHLLHLSEGRIGVMVGDVSTHGFSAALIMALSMSAASIYALEMGEPAGVLRHLDDALRDELETTEMYVSLFYGVLDPRGGSLTYSSAGHPHAFAIHADGSFERLHATDPPVGIAGPDAYQAEVVPWERSKDLLLLFTDGLSDTLAGPERGTGEKAVLEAVVANRDRSAAEIVEDLFSRATEATPVIPADDITALALRV
jgi:sigma-B regulation protein RsbU (phosphoserine phosphatase)